MSTTNEENKGFRVFRNHTTTTKDKLGIQEVVYRASFVDLFRQRKLKLRIFILYAWQYKEANFHQVITFGWCNVYFKITYPESNQWV